MGEQDTADSPVSIVDHQTDEREHGLAYILHKLEKEGMATVRDIFVFFKDLRFHLTSY